MNIVKVKLWIKHEARKTFVFLFGNSGNCSMSGMGEWGNVCFCFCELSMVNGE